MRPRATIAALLQPFAYGKRSAISDQLKGRTMSDECGAMNTEREMEGEWSFSAQHSSFRLHHWQLMAEC
jgi:hypothetical protein